MKVYTLSIDFIKHLDINGILSILYPLINPENDNKIGLDIKLELLVLYQQEVQYPQILNEWISFLSDSSIHYEGVDFNFTKPIDDEQIATMTSCINGAKSMIADSLQTIKITLDDYNYAKCGGKLVHVQNKDSAKREINRCYTQSNNNCIIATDHSTIQKSKITNE